MNVCICAIAKCENLYIKEWVDYHLNLGFDHIYLYDNNEINGERISDVIDDDRVTIVNYRGRHQLSCETQVKAYNECYRTYAVDYDWIMFIDIDEFLTLNDHDNIKDFLEQSWCRKANAIRFHWLCYSDSGNLHYEDAPVLDRFTELCSNNDVNKYYKQIYRTNLNKFRMMNVHYCDYITGIKYPDGSDARYVLQTTDSNIRHDVGFVRHYVTKSLDEFIDIKYKRRGKGSSKTRLNKDFYFRYNELTDEKSEYFDNYFQDLLSGEKQPQHSTTYPSIKTKPNLQNVPTERAVQKPIQQTAESQISVEKPKPKPRPSIGNANYTTPQERAICPGAKRVNNPAIKHSFTQEEKIEAAYDAARKSNPVKKPENTPNIRKNEHQNSIKNGFDYNTNDKYVLPNYVNPTHQLINNRELIIITFTSWKKRIQNCSHIVDLMNKQTLKPNKIILNLSTDEFQNKEKDLPKQLLEKQNDVFEIHWVKEDTKAYKKIMPTLERYPNDVIVSIDDDIDYPLDFIEHIYNEYISFGKKVPITSGEYKWKNDIYTHYGCFSLIKKEFVGDYLNDLYTNVVLKNGIDKVPFCDPIITYAVLLNGLRYRMTPYYNMSVVRRNSPLDKQNRLSELGSDKYKKAMSDEHAIIQKYILEKYKKTYDGLFDAQIIVNITTWAKRDWCLYPMLKHLKNQTLHPDKIVLWLSHEEYDKSNLPQTIQKCIDEKLLTDVMWVEKNTYCHKRFACFEHFRNSYNIFLDDDILYENNFIKEIYNNSKMHQDCVTVYATNSVEYYGYKIIKKDLIKSPSHKNVFMGGCCCFPPYIMSEDVLTENIGLRDIYVKKCDESWLRPFLLRHDIKIFGLYIFGKKYKFVTVDGSQESAVWNENKQVFNGVREKERNFFNAIKITHTEKLCKNIWENISIDNWRLTPPNKQ